MFDRSVYQSPETILEFHDMICNLFEASQRSDPTPFHKLLGRLANSDRLLRLYTQNIDTLENRLHEPVVPLPASGPWPKVIPVHGSLAKMTCTKCQVIKDFNPQLFRIWQEDLPECINCAEREIARAAAGRRKLGVGFIRPRMVLYGEPGYDDVNIGSCMASDLRNRPDALIVVGTTLKIPGTKTMVREMSKAIGNRGHVIWLNTCDAPGGEFEDVWDFVIKGDCQEVARLMEKVAITAKDQSFVAADAEAPFASQQTIPDNVTDPTTIYTNYWNVVLDSSKSNSTGLLTPSMTQISSDDDAVCKLDLQRQGRPQIKTTGTKDFYKPLTASKPPSLKRKRSSPEKEIGRVPKSRKSSTSQGTNTDKSAQKVVKKRRNKSTKHPESDKSRVQAMKGSLCSEHDLEEHSDPEAAERSGTPQAEVLVKTEPIINSRVLDIEHGDTLQVGTTASNSSQTQISHPTCGIVEQGGTPQTEAITDGKPVIDQANCNSKAFGLSSIPQTEAFAVSKPVKDLSTPASEISVQEIEKSEPVWAGDAGGRVSLESPLTIPANAVDQPSEKRPGAMAIELQTISRNPTQAATTTDSVHSVVENTHPRNISGEGSEPAAP